MLGAQSKKYHIMIRSDSPSDIKQDCKGCQYASATLEVRTPEMERGRQRTGLVLG